MNIDEFVVGFSDEEGMRVWKVWENDEGVFEINKVENSGKSISELFGETFRKQTAWRSPHLYGLTGTGYVSLYMNNHHTVFNVNEYLQGKKTAMWGSFHSGAKGNFSYCEKQNIFVSLKDHKPTVPRLKKIPTLKPEADNSEPKENYLLSVCEFGPDFRPRNKSHVSLLFNEDVNMDRTSIKELELGHTLKNQVIVGSTQLDNHNREAASLFDMEKGKEITRLEKNTYRCHLGKSFHYDDKRQVLFIIGDEWYIDGGLSVHDFRAKSVEKSETSSVWKKEIEPLERTYSMVIVDDELWCGTVDNNSMYGESDGSDDDDTAGHINVFDLRVLKMKKQFKDIHKGSIQSMNYLPGKNLVCSCSRVDGLMKFFDVRSLEENNEVYTKSELKDVIFRQSPSVCVSSNSLEAKKLWKLMRNDVQERTLLLFTSILDEDGWFKTPKISVVFKKNGSKIYVPRFVL